MENLKNDIKNVLLTRLKFNECDDCIYYSPNENNHECLDCKVNLSCWELSEETAEEVSTTIIKRMYERWIYNAQYL